MEIYREVTEMIEQNKSTDYLFEAILKLETTKECYDFFEDLCTVKELQSMAQRIEVARMLKEKKTYAEIATKTGASTVTISRVNRILGQGTGSLNRMVED